MKNFNSTSSDFFIGFILRISTYFFRSFEYKIKEIPFFTSKYTSIDSLNEAVFMYKKKMNPYFLDQTFNVL